MEHVFEFAMLFVVIPTAFAFLPHRLPAIPTLWALAGYCLFVLWNDPGFDRKMLWNSAALPQFSPAILVLFAIAALAISAVVYRRAPHLFYGFPRSNPCLWGLIVVLYPILSVYPQGLIFRSFIFHRYRPLFESDVALVLASAIAFSYLHIIFRNSIAVGLTFLGGVIFAARYLQTHSLLISSVEHALYGCFMFTVGLGDSFYHAGVRNARGLDSLLVLRAGRE